MGSMIGKTFFINSHDETQMLRSFMGTDTHPVPTGLTLASHKVRRGKPSDKPRITVLGDHAMVHVTSWTWLNNGCGFRFEASISPERDDQMGLQRALKNLTLVGVIRHHGDSRCTVRPKKARVVLSVNREKSLFER